MLSRNINLNIKAGTVWYNNKILISDGKFSLRKNDKVNALEAPSMNSPKILAQTSTAHRDSNDLLTQKSIITNEEEKIAIILSLTGIFTKWHLFQCQ